MRHLLFACAVVVAFLHTLVLEGQVPAPAKGQVIGPEAPGAATKDAAPTKPGAPTPGAPAQPQESPRLQKLKQLSFDRRPSTILKAWATPPGAAEKEKEKDKEKKADPSKPVPKKDPLDGELAALQQHVTLGHWKWVKEYLSLLPEDEGDAGYKQLLQALQRSAAAGSRPGGGPEMMDMMAMGGMPPGMMMQFQEQNAFSLDDVLGLAGAAPRGLDRDLITSLAGILRRVLGTGNVVEHVVVRFKTEAEKPKERAVLTKRQAAQLLAAADQAAFVGDFLPALDQAKTNNDHEALNLLARHFLALHARDKKAAQLEQAWGATQAILAAVGGPRIDKEEALKRAVELAPRVREELGQTWLEQSFTSQKERGMDILATLGALVSQGLQTQPMNLDYRLKQLQLQKTAVEALLKAAPERATEWQEQLTLLAGNWLKEADYSRQFDRSSGMGPRIRRDPFGNIFYVNDDDPMPMHMMMNQPNRPQPLRAADVLQARPADAWTARVDDGLKAQLALLFAQLYLKVGEEEKAFPNIEQLAGTHPTKARDLVNEFLRVWTRNHDPNEARRHTNMYMYMYGFERRADGIPLTRSKQERNLVELSGWVKRLRGLPCGEPDEELLAKAFTTCHSSAEVYRLEAIETVFGPLGGLKPRTLAGLAQQMRENLAGVWRRPAEQQKAKTNRKPKDIQAEVVRGYQVARGVIDNALKKFPDEWSLVLARAALQHDEVNYRQELARSSDYSANRDEALALFQRAAKLYATQVKDLAEDEESTRVYEQWFYASLGACDLQHLDEEKLPDLRQPPLIRAAIQALPGEVAERHLGKFANLLFTRLSSVKPAAKFRYVRSGFEIVGDHKQAWEARKVYDYYKDLVSEIKLDAVLDGPAKVGHGQPFGVFVNLRHTREIERESGGFSRYLQNQTSMYFGWNYGRPTADYRDKFQAAATEALKEHFDVLSVTFQTEHVNSRATQEYGWRITPYAYLLLKAKGPQIDKLPPLRIDLDFLDTSGYVVLPIATPAVPLDAAPAKGDPRPVRKLQVTQTLDERQAEQGNLVLEVKATGLGLVGELDSLLDLKPEGFAIVKTQDQGVSVAKFDQDSEQNAVVSERLWLVTLQAKPGQPPRAFRFASAKPDGVEMTYQRYQDADLATVSDVVSLEREYARPDRTWLWLTLAAAVGVLALLGSALYLLLRPRPVAALAFALPEHLTPFTVTGLLQRIRHEGRLTETEQTELGRTIQLLEQHYFAGATHGNGAVNLRDLAEAWVLRVR